MNTPEVRVQLHNIIDQIKDNRLLEAVYTLLTSNKDIISYSADGQPLSKKGMDSMIEASEDNIRSGNTINHITLKEEAQSWRKK